MQSCKPVGSLIPWFQSDGVLKRRKALLMPTRVKECLTQLVMTSRTERVQHDCLAAGGDARLSASHLNSRAAVYPQYLRIARGERHSALVLLNPPCEVQRSEKEGPRQSQVPLRQLGRKLDRPLRVGLCLLKGGSNIRRLVRKLARNLAKCK